MFSLGHESEGTLKIFFFKDCSIQWSDHPIPNSLRKQLRHCIPLWISIFKEGIQQNTMETYVLQKHSHTCKILEYVHVEEIQINELQCTTGG